jgi:hypothetical protein
MAPAWSTTFKVKVNVPVVVGVPEATPVDGLTETHEGAPIIEYV